MNMEMFGSNKQFIDFFEGVCKNPNNEIFRYIPYLNIEYDDMVEVMENVGCFKQLCSNDKIYIKWILFHSNDKKFIFIIQHDGTYYWKACSNESLSKIKIL